MRWLGDTLKSFTSSRKAVAGALVGLFIPAIYCLLYLNAIWDPQGNLRHVPAVVVNADEGADLKGEKLQIGQQLVDELTKDPKLDWTVEKDAAAARKGLEDGTYFVMIEVPAHFSAGVADAVDGSGGKLVPIRYAANQGESYIVSQTADRLMEVLREKLNDKLAENFLGQLIDAVGQGTSGLAKAADAAGQLKDGAGKLAGGADKLKAGLGEAEHGAAKLGAGAQTAADGSGELAGGLAQLAGGNAQAAKQLADAAAGLQAIAAQLQQLGAAEGTPEATLQALAQLAAQTGGIGQALQQGGDGAAKLAEGGRSAAVQAKALADGVKQLQQGIGALDQGLKQSASGSVELADNMKKLESGATELQTKLADGGAQKSGLDGKQTLLTAPVELDKQPINPVPNNGTFLAGFFAPMSLWVGGLLLTFLTLLVKWRGWAARSLLPRYLLLAVLGVCQALILDLLLVKGLGVQVSDMSHLILLTIVTSLTFISIIHFIVGLMGVAGNVVVLLLLVAQLGVSGGSYPVAMLSALSRHMSEWMPLTYAVHGFRLAISGGSSAALMTQIEHILLFLAVGIGLHLLYGGISLLRQRKNRNKTKPSSTAAAL